VNLVKLFKFAHRGQSPRQTKGVRRGHQNTLKNIFLQHLFY